MKTPWIDIRKLLWDDDEHILIADRTTVTKPLRLASKLTAQPKVEYACFNSFRENSSRRKDNVSRHHTWVIEFDERTLDEQRSLWKTTDMPYTLTVFSGGKSIHCFIRLTEDCTPNEWKSVADALKRIYPDADNKVLSDKARFVRLPNGLRNGNIPQEVETTKSRIPLQTLMKWIESRDVIKDKEIKVLSNKEIKKNIFLSPSLTHTEKIKAECEARESAFSDYPESTCFELRKLYALLVDNRYKAAPTKRNDLLITMVTFLHDAVGRELAMRFCAEFWKQNQVAWNDSLEKHLNEAEAHWDALDADYPSRLSAAEADIYQAIPEREQTFFRICRSLAYYDDNPSQSAKHNPVFELPMTHHGHRLGLGSKQVSRLIDSFVRWGLIAIVQKGTQHETTEGKIVKMGTASKYQWTAKGTQ